MKKLNVMEEAKTYMEKAIETDQNFTNGYYHLGLILNDPSNYADARKCYLTAIDIEPSFLMAHYHLANLLSSGQRLKKDGTPVIRKELKLAKKHYIESLKLDPKFPKIHFHIALLLEEEGNHADAENHLLKAIELNPDYAKAHYRLALLFRSKEMA